MYKNHTSQEKLFRKVFRTAIVQVCHMVLFIMDKSAWKNKIQTSSTNLKAMKTICTVNRNLLIISVYDNQQKRAKKMLY